MTVNRRLPLTFELSSKSSCRSKITLTLIFGLAGSLGVYYNHISLRSALGVVTVVTYSIAARHVLRSPGKLLNLSRYGLNFFIAVISTLHRVSCSLSACDQVRRSPP